MQADLDTSLAAAAVGRASVGRSGTIATGLAARSSNIKRCWLLRTTAALGFQRQHAALTLAIGRTGGSDHLLHTLLHTLLTLWRTARTY